MSTTINKESHFIKVAPHNVFYTHAYPIDSVSIADQPTWVLVHGLGISSSYMQRLLDAIGHHAHVFAPDLPGFGHSNKPKKTLTVEELGAVLARFIKQLDLNDVVLLGNSAGCQYLIETAIAIPDHISATVLQGPTIDITARTWVKQFWNFFTNREKSRIFPLMREDYRRCGIWRILRSLHFLLQHKIEDRLHLVKCPIIIVRGNNDKICSRAWVDYLKKIDPRVELIEVDHAAHAINWSHPEILYEAVAKRVKCRHSPP